MKILIAVDGSSLSQAAAREVATHIDRYAKQPEVHLLHVRPPIPYPGVVATVGRAAVDKYEREESQAALAVAEKELIAAGVPYRTAWCVGDVVPELAAYVKKNQVDLVVMGSHGQSALANLALGSVTTKCLAALNVPVLVVPRSAQAANAEAHRLGERVGAE
jgi:nucleotide-binding universal stress UspA family protein